MNNTKTHKIVEDICHLGCNRVNDIITRLELGENITETNGLSKQEIDDLLVELKAIMAVYKKAT